MTIKRRAVNDEQKSARRQALIDQAWTLFQHQRYEMINMLEVAQQVGLAKGTVYLYFKTKEQLFLAVLEQQFAAWFDHVDMALAHNTPDLAHLIVASMAARPALARLFAIAHVILEHNIDFDTARVYKHMLMERVTQTGALLENRYPFFAAGEGAQFLLRTYALVIGIENVARPAAIVEEVLAQDDQLAALFRVDFEREFSSLLQMLISNHKDTKGN